MDGLAPLIERGIDCAFQIREICLREFSKMAMPAAEIERLIKATFPDARIELRDLAGDNDHWAAHVVSSAFKGKSRIQQHQMVYEALGGRMGGALHALQLTTACRPIDFGDSRPHLSVKSGAPDTAAPAHQGAQDGL